MRVNLKKSVTAKDVGNGQPFWPWSRQIHVAVFPAINSTRAGCSCHVWSCRYLYSGDRNSTALESVPYYRNVSLAEFKGTDMAKKAIAPAFGGFNRSLMKFLVELKANNNRDWFQENKPRYEAEVLTPSLEFIRAMGPLLKKISPELIASDKRVGGSLMRVYRDTRFASDKTPYKTNVGIHFRHEMGKDAYCPGLYLHIAPEECFLGAGIWHPDSATLKKIREAIDERSKDWKRARDNKKFNEHFELAGEKLKTSPRDYDKDHPMIEDLRRKDFIGVKAIRESEVFKKDFLAESVAAFVAAKPLMKFVCDSIHVPF